MFMKTRIISLFLCLLLCFSFAACGDDSDGADGGSSRNSTVIEGKFIVENGACDYAVVIPENANGTLKFASEEFVDLFREATDVKLPVYTDTNRVLDKNSKYFSIGNTSLFKQASLQIKNPDSESSVYVKTVENSVFMCGGGDKGSLYSVYEFLSELLNFEYYGQDCYTLDKNVATLNLLDMDYAYTPSFEYRVARTFYESFDMKNLQRFRHDEFFSNLIAVNSSQVHNCYDYVSKYFSAHEQFWKATTWTGEAHGRNICFTARGNSEEYAALVNAFAETATELLKTERDKRYMLVSLYDGAPACTCDACRNVKNKYGTDAAAMLLLCNDVRAKIDEWFAGSGKEYARDNFYFGILAYMASEDAPVVLNTATGEYEGIDGFKCADGVCVMYAPIYNDFTRPLTEKVNESTVKNYLGWGAVCDNLLLWGYGINYREYYYPYDTVGYVQEFAKLAKKAGTEYYFIQSNTVRNEKAQTAWAHLKDYIISKLGWDVDVNVPELIENFFKNYYGPAAGAMLQFYNEQTVHSAYLKTAFENYGGRFSCETSNAIKEFWPVQLVSGWLNECKTAYEKIEPLKTTAPEDYKMYYDRIATEEASLLFMMLDHHQGEFDVSVVDGFKEQFKKTTGELGMVGRHDSDLQGLWTELGIAY